MKSKRDRLLATAIGLIVFIKSGFASTFSFNLVDEGEYLHNALRIFHGQLPYEDFFSYQPPLYNYWNAIVFRIFGISVIAPRLVNSFSFAIACVLMFVIIRRYAGRKAAVLSVFAFAFMEVSMERLYYYVFVFAGVWVFFCGRESKNTVLFYISGLLFGLVSLFRIDIGVAYLLGFGFGIVVDKFHINKKDFHSKLKQIISLCVGFIVVTAITIVWLTSRGSFDEFIRSVSNTPLQISGAYSLPIPQIWDILPTSYDPKSLLISYEAFVFYSFVGTYIVYAIVVAKRRNIIWDEAPETIYLFIVAFITFPYLLGRTDLGHIVKACVPVFFIMPYLYGQLSKWGKIYLVLPSIFILIGVYQVSWTYRFFNQPVLTSVGLIKVNKQWPVGTLHISADTIDKSIHFINQNAGGGEVFVAPYMPGLYFLTDRTSPTYVGNILSTYIPDEDEFVEKLSKSNVTVVVYDPVNGPENQNGLKQMKIVYPKLDKYIMDNFIVNKQTEEGWLLMTRKD